VTLFILCPFSVRYVCKLDFWAHILWAFGFALKTGRDNKTLGSPLQGELVSLVEFDAWFDLPWFRGSMIFCIEKPYAFLATLLSWNLVLPSLWLGLRGSLCFFLYIIYFAFLLHFLHTHLSHFASPVIMACICLIMLIIMLGWVVMRCEPFC
jgi:hypothetical protein